MTEWGPSVSRMISRMVAAGLLGKEAPFPITKAGLKAIETINNYGRKMPRFYLDPVEKPTAERRDDVLNGIELTALLRTSSDTVAALSFYDSGTIGIFRNGKQLDVVNNIKEVYAYAEKYGRNW